MTSLSPDVLLLLGLMLLAVASVLGGLLRTVAAGFFVWRALRLLLPALGIGATISYFW